MFKARLPRLVVSLVVFSFACHACPFDLQNTPFAGAAAAAKGFTHPREAAAMAPGDAQIEIAFSPEGGGEALVLKAIQAAKKTIRIAAYSFTSPAVVRALIEAKRRGVEVAVVVDFKNNITEDRTGKARAALNLIAGAGIATRTIARYPIHHDKYMVADGLHVETGSFNYSDAAARRNSENVLVIWNNPQVAATYLQHWQSRFEQGIDYAPSY